MKNKNKLLEKFNTENPRDLEARTVGLPIASRRKRRQLAKEQGVPFEPQYNYLVPFTKEQQKSRYRKFLEFLKRTKKNDA